MITEFEEDGGRKVLLYKAIDQLRQCLDTIMQNPADRRILFHAWNPAVLEEIALPACHLLYQFLPNAARREISLCLYIRSNDVGLGTPFNLTEGAALLHLVGRLTGYTPRWFTYFIGDAHIYENQLDMLQRQLTREPYESPQSGDCRARAGLRENRCVRAGVAREDRAGGFLAGRAIGITSR